MDAEKVADDCVPPVHPLNVFLNRHEVHDFFMHYVSYLAIFRCLPVHLFLRLSLLTLLHLLFFLKVPLCQTKVCIAQEFLVVLTVVSLKLMSLQKVLKHCLVEVVVIIDLTIMLIMNIASFFAQYSVHVTLHLAFLDQLLLGLLILHQLVH